MMRACLASRLFDLDGHVAIDPLPTSDMGDDERRVNSVKTLDGGVAVSDRGFSWADRKITLRWRTGSPAYETRVRNLVQTHSHLYCSTRDGVFLVTAERYSVSGRQSQVSLIVRSREDV